MSKKIAVVFTSNNARILVNPESLPVGDVLMNPDLSKVQGIAPHFWKRVGDRVLPMSPLEQEERLAHHAKVGVDNDISLSKKRRFRKPSLRIRHISANAFWALVGAMASHYLKHFL